MFLWETHDEAENVVIEEVKHNDDNLKVEYR